MKTEGTGMYEAETPDGIRRLLEAAMRTEAAVTVHFKPEAAPMATRTVELRRVRPSKHRPLTRFCGSLEGHDSLENRLAEETGFPIGSVLKVTTGSLATWEESLVAHGGEAKARAAMVPSSSVVVWCAAMLD